MHTFQGLLKKHKVSIYAIVKEMGRDPQTSCTLFTDKIAGRTPVGIVDLTKMIEALNKKAHTNYTYFDIETIPIKFLLT